MTDKYSEQAVEIQNFLWWANFCYADLDALKPSQAQFDRLCKYAFELFKKQGTRFKNSKVGKALMKRKLTEAEKLLGEFFERL